MQKTARLLAFLLSNIALAAPLFAQQKTTDTLIVNELQPVTVTAYRLQTSDLATPLSITTIGQRQLQNGSQQLALDEALAGVPGLFVQNGTNFAQDIRVSIRGFGARSQFGIRGVKILVDGFPESTPDGTAQVDAVDPGSLTGISVIRSGTGGLYGNASGGSVNFSTMKFNDEEWIEIGSSVGSYGFHKSQLRMGGGKANKFLYSVNSSYTATDGYRNHSAMKNWLVNGGFLIPIDSTLTMRCVVTYLNSPLAQDPGALTEEQVDADPTMAREANLVYNADESLWQLRTGIGVSKKINQKHSLNGNIYHTDRSFQARLPFDYVELERSFTGGTISHGFKSRNWELSAGIDLEDQNDDRKRYENESGKRGSLYANQTETFRSIGLFFVQKIALGKRFMVMPSLRYDRMAIGIDDHYLDDNSNDSFQQNYKVFNPTIGLSFLASQHFNFYLNAGSNFETPTLQELVTTIDLGPNGINKDLQPQKSKSLELGSKMLLANGRFRLEATLFRIWLTDEFVLISELERSRFENAGKSNRKGIELGMTGQLGKHLSCSLNYTFSDFKYEEYKSFDGNTTPGIPRHLFGTALRYARPEGFFFNFYINRIGELVADDSNETQVPAYLLANASTGWRVQFPKLEIEPFLGCNNLFDEAYNANIRINAGTRFYEPAPLRNFYAGVKVRF